MEEINNNNSIPSSISSGGPGAPSPVGGSSSSGSTDSNNTQSAAATQLINTMLSQLQDQIKQDQQENEKANQEYKASINGAPFTAD